MMLLGPLLALGVVTSNSGGVWAFVPSLPTIKSPVVATKRTISTRTRSTGTDTSFDPTIFPLDIPTDIIQGGQTVRTYPLAHGVERIQLLFRTNGRPLKCKASLWLGPIRQTHNCEMNIEDGQKTPFRYILKFKNVGQVLRVETSESFQLPVEAGVLIPSPGRQKELQDFTEMIWKNAEKTIIQGGNVVGGHGAVRTWEIPNDVESVQFMAWAKDTGRKSFKMKIEVLQGPNCPKQVIDLQCGGGSQPYHCVFETPGTGWQIRIFNKKFVEDGLFACAVVPYEYAEY